MASAHELRGRYGSWSSAYDRDTARFGWCAPAEVLGALALSQPPASHLRVLDLGVGTGQASRPYLERGAAVTGLDLAPEMLDQARAANGPGSFFRLLQHDLNAPLTDLGFSRPFDTVIGVGVLHFVADLERLIAEVSNLLAPGGRFAFSFIAPQRRPFSSATFVRSADEVEACIERSGLELLEHRPFVAYYDQGDQADPVEYRLVVLGHPRPAPELGPLVAGLDKTACIDRTRVVQIANAPTLAQLPTACTAEDIEAEQREPSARRETDVLAVLAHPDDESIYLGGTLARLTEAGFRVDLLTLTDGAGGRRAAGTDHASLAAQRRRELEAAANILGLRSAQIGAFEDFGKTSDALREHPYTLHDALTRWGGSVVDRIADTIDTLRPRVVLTFHPEHDPNFSLHAHHLACAEACRRAVDRARIPPRRVVGVVHPSKADRGVGLEIPERALGIKRRAIAAHASQSFSSARLLESLRATQAHVEALVVLVERGGLPACEDPLLRTFGSPGWASPRTFPARSPLPRFLAGDPDVVGCYQPPRGRVPAQRRVCTGQQVGLAGGPALVLAKALGALTLGGGEATFWMASHDHDWQEIAGASVWHPGRRIRARWDVPTEMRGRPIGDTRFGPEIEAPVRTVAEALQGPFAEQAAAALRAHYRPGQTPSEAFAGLCSNLWPTSGFTFVAPHRAESAQAARPLVQRLLRDPQGALEAIEVGCNALRGRDVSPPVDGAVFPLFFHDDQGRRQRIRCLPSGRGVDTTRYAVGDAAMSLAELEAALDVAPQRFSPDVLLRPAWQDAVFGITDYVAGPTEFAYWGQAYALHRFLGVEAAKVWLRPTVRVTTPRTRRAGQAPAELAELALALDEAAAALVRDDAVSPADLSRALSPSSDERLERTLGWARRELETVAGQACACAGRARGRTIRVLHRASKAAHRARRRHEGPPDPTDRPSQDREVVWLQLYAHHGPDMIHQMLDLLQRTGPERWAGLELVLEMGAA